MVRPRAHPTLGVIPLLLPALAACGAADAVSDGVVRDSVKRGSEPGG